ncbi:MAG: hypothetical protein IPO81_25065 [Kouleothrix sp.]|nr:hypothetical protein [Kouleothrix sp.]
MASVSNPFVDYLTRYTTASPDHEAAFDEFLSQVRPPSGEPLQLATRVEEFLRISFAQPSPPSVILTGNAGDGKTYLCRQIIATFTDQPVADWEAFADRPVERDGKRLHVIKDLSELGDERGMTVLRGLAASLSGGSIDRYLIAANEGRLRALLSDDPQLRLLYEAIDKQLRHGADSGSTRLVVINLTAVTTSSFVPAALRWMTKSEHWAACLPCPIRDRCPVRHNAQHLGNEHIAGRVQMLYQLLEHLDIHVTVRDMLIHLAYTLTGNRRCAELQRLDERHHDLSDVAYYENVWGGDTNNTFRRKASVVQHLDRLHVGNHSLFEIDDFIVSGSDNPERQAEYKQLFAPAVDINHRRFEQDRRAYVEGGADRQSDEEADALMRWLPHCRRKLFFEWPEVERVNRLIPFLYLDAYLDLLRDEQSVRDWIRRDLVLGLNRAFSHLYLTDSNNLYVTTQYIHSTEQPRPLVRLTIPTQGIELRVDRRPNLAYDCDRPDLHLVIAPPPALTVQGGDVPKPQNWRMNLLLFEYLMRLANGGTYNILAEECELSVRDLKDRLLSAFAREPAGGTIEFFVAERQRYALRKLKIDERGTIRSEG